MSDDLMRERLENFYNNNSFIHIITKGFHYNGWLVLVNDSYIEIRDAKTDSIVLIKISSIDLVEEGRK